MSPPGGEAVASGPTAIHLNGPSPCDAAGDSNFLLPLYSTTSTQTLLSPSLQSKWKAIGLFTYCQWNIILFLENDEKKRKSWRVTALSLKLTESLHRQLYTCLVGDDILTSFYRPLKVEAEFGETLQSVMSIQRKEKQKEEQQKKKMKIKTTFWNNFHCVCHIFKCVAPLKLPLSHLEYFRLKLFTETIYVFYCWETPALILQIITIRAVQSDT